MTTALIVIIAFIAGGTLSPLLGAAVAAVTDRLSDKYGWATGDDA